MTLKIGVLGYIRVNFDTKFFTRVEFFLDALLDKFYVISNNNSFFLLLVRGLYIFDITLSPWV